MTTRSRFLYAALMLSLSLILFACGEIGDIRYENWARYTDKADGYVILVPPNWSAEDETIPGMRGTRFIPTDKYTGDMAGFVYFAVIVKDIGSDTQTPDVRSEKIVSELTTGIWTQIQTEKKVGTFAGKPAILYNLKGIPLYTEYKLKGDIIAFDHQGKMYILFSSATENSYEALKETFGLARKSIKLP